MEVLVVGAGTMGRWFGETVEADVVYADAEPDVAREAARAIEEDGTHRGRTAPLDPADDPERYDAVCLAVPMRSIEDAIERHAPRARSAVLDVAGVMGPALDAMERSAPACERVSLHPLFAPDRAPGSIAVVAAREGPTTNALLSDLEAAGNRLMTATAAEHDEAMKSVQAAAHTAVLAFGLAADRVPRAFETPVYADLRELVERIASGSPGVYADVQDRFEGAEAVADAADRITNSDSAAFEAVHAAVRAEWEVDDGTDFDADPGADDG